ncbi:DNA replication and repair protein RecF [Anoxynatronum buryatiense]|uniref:DNA replication and repair protein RecF n=2 Tax=Anoxynatronum buryatiense TaxID=489973 RepID=A0AA45WW88_9CLOT|nr:DNA replication and repair protein RecF [Anoxynatronum buryatiense]
MLSQFRNYESLQLEFHPGINLILGENAQGKTNLLEALYLCAALRSFRTRRDSEFIRFGASQGYLKMNLVSTQGDEKNHHQMEMMFRPDQKKRVKRNGISQQRISDVMGTFKAVLFSPEDLKIVKDSPSERRQFMDSEMVQVSPRYYHTLLQYQKIMKQRNQLLKNNNPKEEEISIWDNQLSEFGVRLMKQRHRFLMEIEKWAKEIHHSLTGKKEELAIHYQPGLLLPPEWPEKSPEELTEIMEKLLEKNRRADLYRQTTGKGPHRDDLAFTINQMDVRQYGSQGQKRTVVLSLKLAVMEWMKEMTGEYPVLLLDDVTSELDEGRQQDLLEYLKPVQTIITATHTLPGMEDPQRGRLYFVEKGMVRLSKEA